MVSQLQREGFSSMQVSSWTLKDRFLACLMTGAYKFANPQLGDDLETLKFTGVLEHVMTTLPLVRKPHVRENGLSEAPERITVRDSCFDYMPANEGTTNRRSYYLTAESLLGG